MSCIINNCIFANKTIFMGNTISNKDKELMRAFKTEYLAKYFDMTNYYVHCLVTGKRNISPKFQKKINVFKQTHTIGKSFYADFQDVIRNL